MCRGFSGLDGLAAVDGRSAAGLAGAACGRVARGSRRRRRRGQKHWRGMDAGARAACAAWVRHGRPQTWDASVSARPKMRGGTGRGAGRRFPPPRAPRGSGPGRPDPRDGPPTAGTPARPEGFAGGGQRRARGPPFQRARTGRSGNPGRASARLICRRRVAARPGARRPPRRPLRRPTPIVVLGRPQRRWAPACAVRR
jgi:hypothetical protein